MKQLTNPTYNKHWQIAYCLILLSFLLSIFNSARADEHSDWLKKQFSEQHEQLIPVVAVADMFYACNQVRKTDPIPYRLPDLIKKLHKNQLAEKLLNCLGNDGMKSESALNFGLLGCFQDQLNDLPKVEHQQKMKLVKQAIAALNYEEKQKSFTQCVTEQAIHYLK